MKRHDYKYPFRIDPVSGQGMQTPYEAHVEQMIRQVLLTDPGERICLPEFGCGLRRLVFAPNSDALAATTQMMVQGALKKWLGQHIEVKNVTVTPASQSDDPAKLAIRIDYVLLETLSDKQTEVRLLS